MATPRRRPRIAIGFAPGGRSNLINSLTPTADELAAERAQKRSQDQAQFNAFKRGDIGIEALEAYISTRTAEETDAAYITSLTDGLASAKMEETRRTDTKKVEAWRDGGLEFADLEKYFQGRISGAVNDRDREDAQTALAGLRVERNQKQDASILSKWKAGQVSNSEFKSYLQGRLATASSDADRANISAAITGVDQKARIDLDSKMEADYRSGKLGAGIDGVRAYTKYLATQASRTDIAPEEAAQYDADRQIVEDNYNAQVDNRVYYEYLGGQRSYGSAIEYMQKRLETARPEQADAIMQRMVQMKDRESQAMKAAASAGAAGQSKLDAFVKDKVNFAKKQLDEALSQASLIQDTEQRAMYIAAAYQEYGKVLNAASRPLQGGGQSSDSDEYLATLSAVPGQAKLSIMEFVGKYEADRVFKSNETDRQLAGSPTEKASAIAGNIARLIELRDSPYLSPESKDSLAEQIRKERKLADNELAAARKQRDDADFNLAQKQEEYKVSPTNSLAASINKLTRDAEEARNAEGALSRALVANNDELYGYREHDPKVEAERTANYTTPIATDAQARAGERNRSAAPLTPLNTTPAPAPVDPSSIRAEYASMFGMGGHIPSSYGRPAETPLVVDNSAIADQRRGERSSTPAAQTYVASNLKTPGGGLAYPADDFLNFSMPSLVDFMGNPTSPEAGNELKRQSDDIFGRFNSAITKLQ